MATQWEWKGPSKRFHEECFAGHWRQSGYHEHFGQRVKESQENHKALMEALAGIEQVLTKQRTMSMPAAGMGTAPPAPPETIPVVKFYGQNAAPFQAPPPQMARSICRLHLWHHHSLGFHPVLPTEFQLLPPELHRWVKQ